MNSNIDFNIEFCSNVRIKGWIYEISRQSFPEIVDVRSSCGKVYRVTHDFLVHREDVTKKFNLTNDDKLGFDINLKDIFNGIINDYELYVNNKKLWSFSDFLQKLDNFELVEKFTKPLGLPLKNFGSKQILVVYQEKGYLHESLEKICNWEKNYFNKNYHAGIAFIFVPISQLGTIKNKLLEEKNEIITLVERNIVKNLFMLSPSLMSKGKIFLLEEKLNLSTDWNGILSVVSSCTNLTEGEIIKASDLLKILMTFSSYADLFFNATSSLYSYQSGQIKNWMKESMRKKVQTKMKEDIVILSNTDIKRLGQVNQNNCAVFVRTGSLRFLLDIIPLSSDAFVKEALRRGMRVRVLTEQEEE